MPEYRVHRAPPSDTDQPAVEKAAQTCSRRDLEGWPAARCVVRIPGVGELNWLSTRRHRPYRVAGNENQLKILIFKIICALPISLDATNKWAQDYA